MKHNIRIKRLKAERKKLIETANQLSKRDEDFGEYLCIMALLRDVNSLISKMENATD